MPPPRKVDLLPPELREWLGAELEARGYGDYEEVADLLNSKLAEDGYELTLGKSAIHAFGQEQREFLKYHREAGAWAESFLAEEGMDGEAKRHSVLFQMVTTLAFRTMKDKMGEGAETTAQELHFLGRTLKDLMASSGIREKLIADERARAAQEAKAAAAKAVEKSAASMGLTGDTVAAIKAQILGVAA